MNAPRFLRACRREAVDSTPVWFMRQAGRYMADYRRIRKDHSILEICERPELAAEVTLQPVRRLGVDAAILFADILLPARALGLKLEFKKGEGPAITPPVRTEAGIRRLRTVEPREDLWFVLEAIRLIRRELDRERRGSQAAVPLIGFAGAPFTLASYIIEGGPSDHYLNTKSMMHSAPGLWRRLMTHLAKTTADYLGAQIEAGAQAIQLFDSWVGALSAEDYRRFVQPYTKMVFDSLKIYLKGLSPDASCPMIHFGTGTAGFLGDFAEAGGDVISVDWRIPLDQAWKEIGSARAIQGNLDPALLACGSPKTLRPAVLDILSRARGRRGHIFNLGHGILPMTPEANVRAVIEQVRELSSR